MEVQTAMTQILVIEDDLTVGKLVEMLLDMDGYKVDVARDLSTGRRALTAGGQDLVILDLSLPDGSGYELLRYLRIDLDRQTPVLILTGMKQEHIRLRSAEFGVEEYMDKPFSPQELSTRVERLTGR